MVTIYMEGGGDTYGLRRECRTGLAALLSKVITGKSKPKVIACGSRNKAFDRFRTASASPRSGDYILLLIDSEKEISGDEGAWSFLKTSDKWDRPPSSEEDQAQLMIQSMETWIIADPSLLSSYFGQGFKPKKLPSHNLESIPKADLYKRLKAATSPSKKGEYNKGAHSFDLLARIDPKKLQSACPSAKRFFDVLDKKCRKP